MRYGFDYPRLVNKLGALPMVGGMVRHAYDGHLERRYERDWSSGANLESRRKFERHSPELSASQRRAVAELKQSGLAILMFAALLPADMWAAAVEEVDEFERSPRVQRSLGNYRSALQEARRLRAAGEAIPAPVMKTLKAYFITLYGDEETPEIRLDNLWLRIGLRPELLDLVNSYFGLQAKLTYFNLWQTVPVDGEERYGSQRWHRDPEDQRKLRIYLYFRDTDAGAGPLEYIRGTTLGGGHDGFYGWRGPILAPLYPPDEEIDSRFGPAERTLCTGPAGTMVLCDTFGFHRGGVSTTGSRLLATWQYVTPASLHTRRYRVSASESELAELSPEQRFAIS